MKKIYLVRHAKSSPATKNQRDFDRTINERGETDIELVGKALEKRKAKIDLVLCSSATRTTQTAKALAEKLSVPTDKIVFTDDLYLTNVKEHVKQIRKTNQKVDNLMVVGHNPTITLLANELSGAFIDSMPTGSIVTIVFNDNSWKAVGTIKGKMAHFDFPKKFK